MCYEMKSERSAIEWAVLNFALAPFFSMIWMAKKVVGMTREGGCLCGAVRFKADGEPLNVRICHCRNCQKAMGSPFFARAQFPQAALTFEGETARFASSDRVDRVLRPLRLAAVLLAQGRLGRGRGACRLRRSPRL